MNVKALGIHLGALRLGVLFQYALNDDTVINRFVADEDLMTRAGPAAPTLSLSMRAATPEAQGELWRNIRSATSRCTRSLECDAQARASASSARLNRSAAPSATVGQA